MDESGSKMHERAAAFNFLCKLESVKVRFFLLHRFPNKLAA